MRCSSAGGAEKAGEAITTGKGLFIVQNGPFEPAASK